LAHAPAFEKRLQEQRSKRHETPGTTERSSAANPGAAQRSHVPAVGRAPKHRSKQPGQSIGDYLYAGAKIEDASKRSRAEVGGVQDKAPSSIPVMQTKSKNLVSKLRTECFDNIFSLLDSDEDGKVSKESMDAASKWDR
jgi:hypothetical protein